MSRSAEVSAAPSWWDRLFGKRRAPPPPPPSARERRRSRRYNRQQEPPARRRGSEPGGGQRPTTPVPATLSVPVIGVQSASSLESDIDDFQRRTLLFPTRTGGGAEPDEAAAAASSGEQSAVRPPELPADIHAIASSVISAHLDARPNSSFERANTVLVRCDSVELHSSSMTGELEEGEVAPAPPPAAAAAADVATLRAQMTAAEPALQRLTQFNYDNKTKRKLSELTVDAEKLLHLWSEALQHKHVLTDVIQDCIVANSVSSQRLTGEVRELELLYRELSEALAGLRRTADAQRAVRADTRTMKRVVADVSSKEQAEVGKVASVHEPDVFSKWQMLRSSNDVSALKEIQQELLEKQRAVTGLESLVRRRLRLSQSAPGQPDGTVTMTTTGEAGTAATATAAPSSPRKANKGGSHRVPPSPSRRPGRGAGGKRRLAEDARQERRAANTSNRDLLVIRYQGAQSSGAAVSGVSSQTAGGAATTVTTSVMTPVPAPPPPPPPPPPPGATSDGQLLPLAAVVGDEDSGSADDTSTSNEDEPATAEQPPPVPPMLTAAAFPLHLSAAIFDSLDPTDSAELMHFH